MDWILDDINKLLIILSDIYMVERVLSNVRLFVTPWTVAHQASLSMGFSRQEYWGVLPFPPPGDLPTQGSNLHLLHCRQILFWWVTGEAYNYVKTSLCFWESFAGLCRGDIITDLKFTLSFEGTEEKKNKRKEKHILYIFNRSSL